MMPCTLRSVLLAVVFSLLLVSCSVNTDDSGEGPKNSQSSRSAETDADATAFGEAPTSSGLSLPSNASGQPDSQTDALLCDRRDSDTYLPRQANCPYFTELSGLLLPLLENKFGVSLAHNTSGLFDTGENISYSQGTVNAHVTLHVVEGDINPGTVREDIKEFLEFDLKARIAGSGGGTTGFDSWTPEGRNEELSGLMQYAAGSFETSATYKLPDVRGSKEFTQQTRAALKLLKTDAPDIYVGIVRSVDLIEEVEKGSGMYVDLKTYKVGKETAFPAGIPRDLQIVWYASTIAHDANHSQRFLRSLKEYRGITGSEISPAEYNSGVYYETISTDTKWREQEGEMFALTAQIEALKLIDDGAKVLALLKYIGISEQSLNLPTGGSGSSEAWFASRSDNKWQEYMTKWCGNRRPCSFEMNLQKKIDDPESDPYWKLPPCEKVEPGADCRHW